MGQSGLLKRQAERDARMLDIGMRMGAQMTTDYIQISLRRKEAMGKDTFGQTRIKKLFDMASQMDDYFHSAFSGGVEADYKQEELDAALREIWGDELIPFRERYPWLKELGYGKAQKGWVK